MDEKNFNLPPSFTSLTEIMERFQTVPYDQFQQELQSWFEHSLAKQEDLFETKELYGNPNFQRLLELTAGIYHQAELLQALSDSQISQTDEK